MEDVLVGMFPARGSETFGYTFSGTGQEQMLTHPLPAFFRVTQTTILYRLQVSPATSFRARTRARRLAVRKRRMLKPCLPVPVLVETDRRSRLNDTEYVSACLLSWTTLISLFMVP